MANIKSAKKRILVNETKAARNKAIRSKVKTACKKVDAAVTAGDKAAAQVVLNAAISVSYTHLADFIQHAADQIHRLCRSLQGKFCPLHNEVTLLS